MLTFNPNKRLTIEECIKHPYFEGLLSEEGEPMSKTLFDWTWDNFELTREKL